MMIKFLKLWCPPMSIAFLMASCSIGQDFKDMQNDSAKAKAAIEEEFSGEVNLSWKITNGKITRINVVFSKLPNENEGVTSAMKARLQEIVTSNFRRPVPKITVSM